MTRSALNIRERDSVALSVTETLALAGAHAWTPEAVVAYKARELAKCPGPSLTWRLRYQSTYFFHIPMWTILAMTLAFAFAACVPSLSVSWWIPVAIGGADVVLFGLYVYYDHLCVQCKILMRLPARWFTADLDTSNLELPAAARSLINSIKSYYPGAVFKVDMLVQDTILDPVLWMTLEQSPTSKQWNPWDWHPVLVWDIAGKVVPPPPR